MMKQMVIDDTLLDALDMNVDSMISDLVSLVAIKDGIDGLEDFDYENMSEELCNAIANENFFIYIPPKKLFYSLGFTRPLSKVFLAVV